VDALGKGYFTYAILLSFAPSYCTKIARKEIQWSYQASKLPLSHRRNNIKTQKQGLIQQRYIKERKCVLALHVFSWDLDRDCKFEVFGDLMLCRCGSGSPHFEGRLCLRSLCNYSPNATASHSIILQSPTTPQSEHPVALAVSSLLVWEQPTVISFSCHNFIPVIVSDMQDYINGNMFQLILLCPRQDDVWEYKAVLFFCCVYIYICVRMYVLCACVFMYVCLYACMHECSYAVYVCMHACVRVYAFV
jgi:hypothetical protein